MIYFDSDVLIHYFVRQDPSKHKLATRIFQKHDSKQEIFISLLTLQETSFVLSKLLIPDFEIVEIINSLLKLNPPKQDILHFSRATEIASKTGFNRINDCIHLAIAETYCRELITFNRKDFQELKQHTDLKVKIL